MEIYQRIHINPDNGKTAKEKAQQLIELIQRQYFY
jgi:hypothetical protein